MIISHLKGGLGNQMFQYALGRKLAITNGTRLSLDISSYQVSAHRYRLDHYNIAADIVPISKPKKADQSVPKSFVGRALRRVERKIVSSLPNGKKVVTERHYNFDPEILCLRDGARLDGYWQSERYFADIADVIRKELTIKHSFDPANQKMAQAIRGCESVSLHIRRGDYVTDPNCNKHHGTCPISYYQAAAREIASVVDNPCFFVFSDDLEWARHNLELTFPTTYVGINGSDKDYEDMRLMSLCRHHVIANSTFSWWGAWLCDNTDKVVIAPKKWFNNPDLNTDDVTPQSWWRI
ncbi:MAG: alpha-1,2-fucosyltransferase [Armatimonadetes bacterium]|nr:alpha-1,2-fucosyltransferase [Armatimonadota bacterium]